MLSDYVADAATDRLARDRVTDFVITIDWILDALEQDASGLRDVADDFICGPVPYVCDDDPSTDDC